MLGDASPHDNNITFGDCLITLFDPGDHVSLCVRPVGKRFRCKVVPVERAAHGRLDPAIGDVWFGLNPVVPGTRGRGRVADLTSIESLCVDLDVKDGALRSLDDAEAVLRALDGAGLPPLLVLATGGGVCPVWRLGGPAGPAAMAALGRGLRAATEWLAEAVLGYPVTLDSTHDPCRVVRVPGTINFKYDPPRPTSAWRGNGERTSREALLAALLELGIDASPPPPRPARPLTGTSEHDDDAAWERVIRLAVEVRDAEEGSANTTAARVCWLAGTYCGAGQLDRDDVVEAFLAAISGYTWADPRDEATMIKTITYQVDRGAESPYEWKSSLYDLPEFDLYGDDGEGAA